MTPEKEKICKCKDCEIAREQGAKEEKERILRLIDGRIKTLERLNREGAVFDNELKSLINECRIIKNIINSENLRKLVK